MAQDAMSKLFGSEQRVRLLRLFLFNPRQLFTLGDVERRTQVPAAAAKREALTLKEAGLLRATKGKELKFGINDRFPYIAALQQMLLYAPLRGNDVSGRLSGVGVLRLIVLAGMFVGDFDGRLDILVVGDRINEKRLKSAMKTLEADIGKELRFAFLGTQDFLYRSNISDRFLRDIMDYPHRIVLDKLNIGLT